MHICLSTMREREREKVARELNENSFRFPRNIQTAEVHIYIEQTLLFYV